MSSRLKCARLQKTLPNITPFILLIQPEKSILGDYVVANIIGYNFSLGGTIGYSTVTFGNITKIPITFNSSTNISFVVPVINVTFGVYRVQVVNNRYPQTLYSNIEYYTLTDK